MINDVISKGSTPPHFCLIDKVTLNGQSDVVAYLLAADFNPAVPGHTVIAGDDNFHDRGLPNSLDKNPFVLLKTFHATSPPEEGNLRRVA